MDPTFVSVQGSSDLLMVECHPRNRLFEDPSRHHIPSLGHALFYQELVGRLAKQCALPGFQAKHLCTSTSNVMFYVNQNLHLYAFVIHSHGGLRWMLVMRRVRWKSIASHKKFAEGLPRHGFQEQSHTNTSWTILAVMESWPCKYCFDR